MAISVSLPKELEARVRGYVNSGHYSSVSELICEALRLFETHQTIQQSRLAAFQADISQGFADVKAGRVSPVNMADIKAEGRRLRKAT